MKNLAECLGNPDWVSAYRKWAALDMTKDVLELLDGYARLASRPRDETMVTCAMAYQYRKCADEFGAFIRNLEAMSERGVEKAPEPDFGADEILKRERLV